MEKAEKGNNTDESDFSENEMLDLNSLNLNQKQTSESLTVVAVMIRSSHWQLFRKKGVLFC